MTEDNANQLEELVKQLKQLHISEFDHAVLSNLPNLISGLESCKNIICDNTTTIDEKEKAWSQVVETVELLANAAKSDHPRDSLGASGAFELIVAFMNLNVNNRPRVDYQCLRALANFCITHDVNRQKFIDIGGIDVALNCLKQKKDLETIRASSATLLNAGLNYNNVNVGIVNKDGLNILAEILDPEHVLKKYDDETARTCVYFATRVIINLIGTAEGKREIGKTKIITSLVQLLKYSSREDAVDDDVDILENVVEILETVALESDEVQQILVRDELFTYLLDFLEFSKPPLNCEQRIIKSYGSCKAAVLKVIVSTAMSDSNMEPLFGDDVILQRFLQWLNSGPERDDLQMCSALSLGNLARSDTHCTKLVHQFKIGEPLANVLKTSDNIKVQHAVISVLKNISLPVENKAIIGSLGIIGLSAPLLEKDTVQPVQLGVVGILKHLSSSQNNISNSVKIILGEDPADTETPTPLSRLLSLIKRTDEIPVRSEGTRVLVNLVKNLWSELPDTESGGISMKTLRQKLNKLEIVEPLVIMVIESKYPILQNEGIIALTILSMDDTAKTGESNITLDFLTSKKEKTPAVVEEQSNEESTTAASSSSAPPSQSSSPQILNLLNAITDIILNEKNAYPDEIRSNACMFLEKASKASSGHQKQYLRQNVPPVIEPLIKNIEQNPLNNRLEADIKKVLKSLD
ncbi:ARM repeat-containing protein [Rhizophagus irregularis]|uniref:ARM repeat-containing protein n=2 Tax=Rhizophagus irregularis TaxID=588596 RepID=A0A2I1DRE3_9GLOM|nr:armadillo-type protein [Rhizophagus irregularis DAOM 181602=DAOM 197198]PKC17977.1 ARM repeat-containing protein [Rhizophagus irregularis]PKC74785.1 ARM repeat-containing protein [Rhizophagus irregularis]PKY12427.1 ARM repeat-containing protein [Rhizophagus irregularis]POG70438.1 armadillo-type protein [Rhizophagus irregularis DAOM 181602=DAOM 197198]UZO19115.1 hypothetical protein OCT59_010415 [Rhizophagus irregularis]|eukprot:XP_025177304.1 armadillo-type protein [Rhizophagus irregularis DAOM 181602=DAOM 197198]